MSYFKFGEFLSEEQKLQIAINSINIYNLKEAYRNGTQDDFVVMTELPSHLDANSVIMMYFPVQPEFSFSNFGLFTK